ncbi:MAG: hypothetical protein GY807_20465 [Gammaproteobacteria bacterium]|nr:hypothetical protein [Gammaproteobacteria bacterium]
MDRETVVKGLRKLEADNATAIKTLNRLGGHIIKFGEARKVTPYQLNGVHQIYAEACLLQTGALRGIVALHDELAALEEYLDEPSTKDGDGK